MAKLTGLVVIYGADKYDLFAYRGVATVLACPAICVNECGECIPILYEGGQVFRSARIFALFSPRSAGEKF